MNTSTRTTLLSVISTLLVPIAGLAADGVKLITQGAHISFFSSTPAEDIESDNYSVVSSIDTGTGEIAFSVPMQSFEFKKSLMQKHFNQKEFLHTKVYPRATFKGKVTNLETIDFGTNGSYPAVINGVLTIKGNDQDVTETGTLIVKDGAVTAEAKFNLTLADFGVAFKGGKPAKNIAKIVEVTVRAPYEPAS
jgi:polyisoprenoid-binding protein YceI